MDPSPFRRRRRLSDDCGALARMCISCHVSNTAERYGVLRQAHQKRASGVPAWPDWGSPPVVENGGMGGPTLAKGGQITAGYT